MRIVNISDTHSLHNEVPFNVEHLINPQDENILLHSGDITDMGTDEQIINFLTWFSNIKGFDKKIFIAGNHDFNLEHYKVKPYSKGQPPVINNIIDGEGLKENNVIYLEDEEYIFNSLSLERGVKFYGSPWQPEFGGWAYNLPRYGAELELKWNKIPNDTDILITHGPAFGHRDLLMYNTDQVGCSLLRDRIKQIKPTVHVFGHIHHSYGIEETRDTLFVNASICDEGYNPIHLPIVVDLFNTDGKIDYKII